MNLYVYTLGFISAILLGMLFGIWVSWLFVNSKTFWGRPTKYLSVEGRINRATIMVSRVEEVMAKQQGKDDDG